MHFNIKLRATRKRILAFILLTLIPLSFVVLGLISHLVVGQIVSVFSLFTWFILPLVGEGLLAIAVFAELRIRVLWRGVAIALLLILLMAASLHLYIWAPYELFQRYENEDAMELSEYYRKETEGFPHMPTLTELASPENIAFCSYYSRAAIFDWCSCMLIVRYTPEDYVSEKAALQEKFTFQEEPLGWQELCEPTAEVSGYTFRVLSVEGEYEHIYEYPYKMMLIGTNDKTHELVYLTFLDRDLDYIEDLATFILEDCGFRYVK